MKRLQKENKNTPTSYIQKPPDWFDRKRLKTLLKFYRGGHLLDLGSCNSQLIDLAKEIEMEYNLSGWARNIDAVDWMPEKLEYDDNLFDYVVMGELLEHLDDPAKAVKEAMRVLKVGGVLALSVPLNETEAGEVDGLEGHHLWSFDKDDIIKLLEPYGAYEIEILRSEHIPKYRYHFPSIVAFCQKK